MNILLCMLDDGLGADAARMLADVDCKVSLTHTSSEGLRAMAAELPGLVVVGGVSTDAIADVCRQLRAADISPPTVIVALANDLLRDLDLLLSAGADDVLMGQSSERVFAHRLSVAKHGAMCRRSRKEADADRERFLSLSGQLLSISNFEGYFIELNSEWTRVLGWSGPELLSKRWLEFVHPDDRAATRALARAAEGGGVTAFTHRFQCKDGSYRSLAWRTTPQTERGVMYSAVLDTTEERRVEHALADLTESITTTFNSIGDGVIATDTDGRITRMNPVAERLTHWPLGDARGKPLVDVLPIVNQDTRVAVESPIESALREGAKIALAKRTVLVRRDGSEIPIADSCAPIKSAEGLVTGAVLVFRDLSAQRNVEATQAALEKKLAFADRLSSVGTLAAGVAHEINNPLTFVGVNVDMAIEVVRVMSGGPPTGGMRQLEEMLVDARDGVTRIAKIVRGLKTFSRIEADHSRAIKLGPAIELSIGMVLNEIRHRATLTRDFGITPLVDADEARLCQVLVNLLINAAHCFPDGTSLAHEITVRTWTDPHGRAVIEVGDNGPGIPPAILGRVFDPFFTTKSDAGGTGLGLAVSHNLVTSMGGDLSVESKMGRGTVFRVCLPASNAREPSAPPAPFRAPTLAPERSAQVLVVDDEVAIGVAIRRVLQGHDVTVVTTAPDALALLETGKRFDVVLADLMMPGVSGMELYRTVLERYPTLAPKVVFITGGAFTAEAHAFLNQVKNPCLEKPFDTEKLRAMVREQATP